MTRAALCEGQVDSNRSRTRLLGVAPAVVGIKWSIINELATVGPDAARIDLLLQFILAVAAEQDDFRDRELGPIHLLKYAYLADLAHAARRDGATFSGARWIFHHFGPWALEVFERIEPAVVAAHGESKRLASSYGDDFVRYRLTEPYVRYVRERGERELPLTVQACLTRAVQEFGQDTASLLRNVYQTPPMLNAAPDEDLDFMTVVRERAPQYVDTDDLKKPDKRRIKTLNEARAEVQARLAKSVAGTGNPVPEPRYDGVFAAGVQWLDGLAGEPVRETKGKLAIADDVWKSDTRREPEIP